MFIERDTNLMAFHHLISDFVQIAEADTQCNRFVEIDTRQRGMHFRFVAPVFDNLAVVQMVQETRSSYKFVVRLFKEEEEFEQFRITGDNTEFSYQFPNIFGNNGDRIIRIAAVLIFNFLAYGSRQTPEMFYSAYDVLLEELQKT
jgi:hypothetical protein